MAKLTKKTVTEETEEILDEVLTPEDREDSSSYESSIRIYENGESETFEMPAGYIDEDGVCHKTFTIREMTGRDEEAISKSEYKQNSSKLISVLLERCLVSIGSITKKSAGDKWKDIVKNLLVGDQDFILVKIRELSIGKEVETNHSCPYCKANINTFLDLSELEVKPFKGNRTVNFSLPRGYRDKKGVLHNRGVMRLPEGRDREILTPIAKKNVAQASTLMLTRLCKFDEGFYVTEDIIRDLSVRDREYLQKLLQENLFGIDLTVTVTCPECGEEFKGSLSATNFI